MTILSLIFKILRINNIIININITMNSNMEELEKFILESNVEEVENYFNYSRSIRPIVDICDILERIDMSNCSDDLITCLLNINSDDI